jgi:hypothetical protein
MTWFNWHEPQISPAQGFYTLCAFLALYLALKLFAWFLREPAGEVERFENVDGDGR